MGFPGGSDITASICNAEDPGSVPGSGRALEKGIQPAPVFLPGEFHEQRSLVGYSPWGRKGSDTTERPSKLSLCLAHRHSTSTVAAAAAKSLQLCLTLCDSKDCSPPGSSVHGILQARTLKWLAISFSRGSS